MGPTQAIRIVIVDGRAAARENLRAVFLAHPSVTVIGEASKGRNALTLVSRLSPDIVLVDADPPGMGAVEISRAIGKMGTATKVIMITGAPGGRAQILAAMDAGVMGYLLKGAPKNEFLRAVKNVGLGIPEFAPAIRRQLQNDANDDDWPHLALTPRELDILKEIASGKNNRKIASDLNLTEGTIKGYVSIVLSKLALRDRTQAALYAIRHGL